MSRHCPIVSVTSWLVIVAMASTANAQSAATPAPSASIYTDDHAQLRLRYGIAIRDGSERDLGAGLTYSGISPNDLAFEGWLWFLLEEHLGVSVGIQREAFSLLAEGQTVTSGALLRTSIGPTGRLRFGPVRLELVAAYAFAQLPLFGTISTPTFSTVERHSILLGARGLLDLGPVTLEGRFEYPLVLATSNPNISSTGTGVGGGVRLHLFRTGVFQWGLMANVMWHSDAMSAPSTSEPLNASQSIIRTGLALDIQWKTPPSEEARLAVLTISVRDEDGPVAGATVALEGESTRPEVQTQADGTARIDALAAGEWFASARFVGHETGEVRLTVNPGDDRAITIALNKEKPKRGALAIKVISAEGAVPVLSQIQINEKSSSTSAEGALTLENLAVGPLPVKATAAGFQPAEEVASIVAGRTSTLTLTLVPEKKQLPATLRGQARSARDGSPVVARLEFRELKRTVRADEKGVFTVEIPGGEYTIRIVAEGFLTQSKTITVRAGDQTIFNVDLTPK